MRSRYQNLRYSCLSANIGLSALKVNLAFILAIVMLSLSTGVGIRKCTIHALYVALEAIRSCTRGYQKDMIEPRRCTEDSIRGYIPRYIRE